MARESLLTAQQMGLKRCRGCQRCHPQRMVPDLRRPERTLPSPPRGFQWRLPFRPCLWFCQGDRIKRISISEREIWSPQRFGKKYNRYICPCCLHDDGCHSLRVSMSVFWIVVVVVVIVVVVDIVIQFVVKVIASDFCCRRGRSLQTPP